MNKDPQKKQVDFVDWVELIKFKETRNYVQRVMENYNVRSEEHTSELQSH